MSPLLTPQVSSDMEEVVARSAVDLMNIGQRDVILTGATGFVGHWLSLSYLVARRHLSLPGKLYCIARDPASFSSRLQAAGLTEGFVVVPGDVRNITSAGLPSEASVVHAATPARATLNSQRPLEMIDIIVAGQMNLMNLADELRASSFLFLSSGAVYGRQPHAVPKMKESWEGSPILGDVSNAYHEGKRMAEMIGNSFASMRELKFTSARLFAFLAPFLPLNEHFAAGNFLGNASKGEPIQISSGGGSIRSYQYGTDLAVWLWALLARGRSMCAYNVGSDQEVSIKALAELISRISPGAGKVQITGVDTDANVTRYVPDITLAREELMLTNEVILAEAISRTLNWVGST
jgi:nucleoside-diphosphate-sugar epimerase